MIRRMRRGAGRRRSVGVGAGEMADPSFAERIDVRIATLDAEIARVQANADGEIARLDKLKRNLVKAKSHLTPEREELLLLLQKEGLI